jgi:regulator of CtrA degradation
VIFTDARSWQHGRMGDEPHSRLHRRLIDTLYVEAMLLADEARGYFDDAGRGERDSLDALTRVVFSCESMKVTTRLMHVIAWLLTQRAVAAGELRARDALDPSRRLGDAPETDASVIDTLPDGARILITASIDLHRRVARFDSAQSRPKMVVSPAKSMMDRLQMAF